MTLLKRGSRARCTKKQPFEADFVVAVLPLPVWTLLVYKVSKVDSTSAAKRSKTCLVHVFKEHEIPEASTLWVAQLFAAGCQDNVLSLSFFGPESEQGAGYHDTFVIVCKFFDMAGDGECEISSPIYLDSGKGHPSAYNIDHSLPDLMFYLMSGSSFHVNSSSPDNFVHNKRY